MKDANRKTKMAMISTLVAALAVAAFVPSGTPQIALAQDSTGGLHFVGQPSCTPTDGTIVCTGEVAGAGRTATATVEATATVTQGCINKGENEPRGLQETTTTVTGSETFNTRSGRGTFSVETDPITSPTGDFTCPSRNMRPTLVDVEFTDITLTVTSQTGTVSESF